MSELRTRFAPSPTGYMHIGGIRTALFAWLLARHEDGKFILRFEDTDKSREVSGAKDHIIKSLKSLGLDYDEGPDIGGNYGPYTQSERLDVYKKWADKLVTSGRAYVDPYSSEEVQAFRQEAQKQKKPFLYRNHRPSETKKWDGSQTLRFKSDPKSYDWHDEVMGDLKSGPETIDDFVLLKSDGFPTYNFAHIIDDQEMKISHVLRGQEFISSVPNYLNLYEALAIPRPKLVTLPHILSEAGNKKLSKRDGAKDILDYLRDGYMTEALVSFIATLGWNDGSTQETFSTEELIDKFSLDRIQRSGARFDEQRLNWVNGHFIRNLPLEELFKKVVKYWPEEAKDYDDIYKKRVLGLLQERLKYYSELPELSIFFFKDLPVNNDLIKSHKQLKKMSGEELIALLSKARETLNESNFSEEDITDRLNKLLEETNQKPAILFSLIRIATTSAPSSPGLSESLELIGKSRSLKRIDDQIASLMA
jgi:glutamyl-tRNA synthetase